MQRAEPGATDNLGYAQWIREGSSFRPSEARCLSFIVRQNMNPEDDTPGSDWKLKLRYGRLKTPYSHYTVIAKGRVTAKQAEFDCPIGNAFMGMKVWASSYDEAADMISSIGSKLSFQVSGKIEVFDTEAKQPPRDVPFGYDIGFTPFRDED